MSIQALREQLSQNNKDARALLAEKGDRVWTADEQAKFDGFMDAAERLEGQINAHQRLLDSEAAAAVPRHAGGGKADGKKVTDAQRAVDIFLRKSDRQMSAEEALLVRNTMSTTTGSQGGYTVPSEIAGTLIETLKSFGAMRRVAASLVTAEGRDLSYPTSDGTSEVGEIVAQNADAAEADPSFGTRALNVYKFSSKVIAVPLELLQDSNVDIEALVRGRVRQRIGRIQNQMFTTGTGSSQPTGLMAAASVGRTGAAGQTATIIYDDLVELVDSLDVAYTDEGGTVPQWMFSQSMRKVLRKLKDSAGRPLWTPSYDAGLVGTRTDMLMDYPVIINNDVAAPAASAKSLAFGQFGAYMVRDAMDVTLFRFDDSAYIKKGQVGFLAWSRSGGNLMDTASVKVYQHPAS